MLVFLYIFLQMQKFCISNEAAIGCRQTAEHIGRLQHTLCRLFFLFPFQIMKRMTLCLALVVSTALFAACAPSATKPVAVQKLQLTASFYPLAFLAREIGGDLVEVQQVTPGGVEPHDFEPTPEQIVAMNNAKIFLMNGEGVDPWADKVRNELEQKGVITVKMTENIPLLAGVEEEDEDEADPDHSHAHAQDPHIWLSPVNARAQAELIRDALLIADPGHAEMYTSNTAALLQALAKLDEEFRAGLSDCSVKQVVVSHNAFRYMAKEYGFETLAIAGLSPDQEPSPKRIAEVATLAKQIGIKYIFFESLVSPKLAQTVADEIGAQSLVLNPIEGLTDGDVMRNDNYLSIMRQNLANLRTAMQCQ